MCRAIIFDLDGTIAESVEAHVEAWRRAMEELGRKPSEDEVEKFRKGIGKPLYSIMKDIYGDLDDDFLRKLRMLKNKHFTEVIERVELKVPREVLEKLKEKYRLGIFTSTTRETAKKILEHLGISVRDTEML